MKLGGLRSCNMSHCMTTPSRHACLHKRDFSITWNKFNITKTPEFTSKIQNHQKTASSTKIVPVYFK